MKIFKISLLFIILTISFLGFNLNAQTKSPEPKCGFALTKKIIQKHLVYPKEALDQKKGGKITVYYDVDKAGNASNYRVEKAFDEQCAEEAIRLVKMIEWNPAMKDGKNVDANDYYAVEFSPKSYQKAENKNPRLMLPEQAYPSQKSNKIYDFKELHTSPKPYFDDPQMSLGVYFRTNLEYPEQARQFEIQGTVKLDFVVETDGRASNIMVENSVGGGCDNEAIRLIQDLVWTPGVKNDSLVRSRLSQEITFQIGERNYHDGNSY